MGMDCLLPIVVTPIVLFLILIGALNLIGIVLMENGNKNRGV